MPPVFTIRNIALTGSLLMAATGFIWCWASFAYIDAVEGTLCATVGLGFLLLSVGLIRPAFSRLAPLGLVVASVPAIRWMQQSLSGGYAGSPWVLFGVGIALAAIVALWSRLGNPSPRATRIGLGLAFALAAVSAFRMVVAGLENPSGWLTAEILATAGLALLVLTSQALAPDAKSRRAGG